MSEAVRRNVSLISSQLENRRFNGETLRILESVLVTKDVRSLVEIRSAAREILRSKAMPAMGEIAEMGVDHKLRTAEFFLHAFALVGDIESCLALKYEALVLRDTKYTKNHDLRVSYEEWFTFAKDSFDNGFYAIAVKGFESALMVIQSNVDPELDTMFSKEHVIDKIEEFRDMSVALIASHSVQTESAEYMKAKAKRREIQKHSLHTNSSSCVASSMFRSGINKRNMRKLIQSREILRVEFTSEH